MTKSEEKTFLQSQKLKAVKKLCGWRQRGDNFRRFSTRRRSVSSELVMIGNARQWLSRFGVKRGKMEVPVWYGGARETERDEICYFGEWEMEEWQDSEIWYFQNCLCPVA